MTPTLLDAAFRLVSHSFTIHEARIRPFTTLDARLAELRKNFPESDLQTVEEADGRARHLVEVAREMADAARGPLNDHSGPPLNESTLSLRCPDFSSPSYLVAIEDGYVSTR
jgi:hypothetical protein